MVHSETLSVVITANGEGRRMKAISPKPKHLLYYGGKRIIDHIKDALSPFGPVEVLEGYPTASRRETLEPLRGRKNVLICDCDIIPVLLQSDANALCKKPTDAIFYFASNAHKYGCLWMDNSIRLTNAAEHEYGTQYRASGLYFLKDVGATLDRMTDPDSLASGMIGARMILENSFIRLGDPEDYLNALK